MQNTIVAKKILTLCFLDDGARILLGMKKRGFGTGKWNGFGGKVEEGETIEAAARRELREEAGMSAHTLTEAGTLTFHYAHERLEMTVHVFRIVSYDGFPQESEEMRPQWFAFDDIPYDQMWIDDRYWLPIFLKKQIFRGTFYFKNYDTFERHEIEILEEGVWNPAHASVTRG